VDVTINRGVEWRDDLRNVAPDLWPELIGEYRAFCKRNLPSDCRHLLRMIIEGEHVGWAGYQDKDQYLRDGLALDPQAVEWAVHGLSIAGVEAPVPFKEAQQLGKRQIGIEGGKAGPGRGHKTGYDVTRLPRGNSAAYREAKGKRDRLNAPAPYYREKPLTTLRRAWKRASAEEREEFLREVT